ncbi:MAG TPA: S9 family peptidase [Rhodocyclaceae bacterium]
MREVRGSWIDIPWALLQYAASITAADPMIANRKFTAWLCLALLGVLTGCAEHPARHPALATSALPELLPVRAFFANTDFQGGYQISPDGRKLAWMAVSGLRPAIFVQTIGTTDGHALSLFSPEFRWAGDSRHLLLRKDRKGDENLHVWLVDTEPGGEAPLDLTPFDRTRAEIVAAAASGKYVLIADNRRDARVFDLYRIDLETRASTLVAENPGDVASWIADMSGELRGRTRYSGERNWLEVREAGRWKRLYSWTAQDIVEPLCIDTERSRVWLRSNLGRDKAALVAVSTSEGRETVYFSDPDTDVTEAAVSRISGEPLYAVSHPDFPRIEIFDRRLREELGRWRDRPAGEREPVVGMEFLGADLREENFLLSVYDHAGKRYHLWNRSSGADVLLGSDALNRHAAALAPIRPVAFASRDGLTLRGYLTLPKGASPRRLPMVLLVHGGPWARNTWADPDFLADALRVQFLANRGYAVLQVNYRGSLGYGRKFQEAAIGQFGGTMQNDLLDAVAWAVNEGYADPAHVAIMGASYGGYATLAALTTSPRTFACGVDLFGVSDLVSLLENFPPYWQYGLPMWQRFVGNPSVPEERRRLMDASPLWKAASVERPLLIIHGTGDVRSGIEQSERMVEALRAAGKPVEYVKIAGMGHGSWHWPHNLRTYRKTEDFLARCLGGRSSGFDWYELGAWAF